MRNKLIIYELNEVPKRLIDEYAKLKPNSFLAKIHENNLIETFTEDEGELHPWTTWPTFYRGVSSKEHKIKFINQNLNHAKKFPSVWEILQKNDLSIGIFGSLQSYPPLKDKNISFYLPDTFSPDADAYPIKLSIFQDFNLSLVGNNKAKVGGITFKDIKKLLKCYLLSVLKKRTLGKIIIHLIKEVINPKYKIRRSLLQPILSFEPFFDQLESKKPDFVTFFTNHVAGVMHRYWFDFFPKDFKRPPRENDLFRRNTIIKALDIADSQIRRLKEFADLNSYDLWIASSMGQASIDRGKYIKELNISNFPKLINKLNLNITNYELVPAMHPDFNVICKNEKGIDELKEALGKLTDSKGNQIIIFRYKPVDLTLNLILKNSEFVTENNLILFEKRKYHLKQFGLELFKRDIGTGYHIPHGILYSYPNKLNNIKYKKYLNTKYIAPLILNFFNIKEMEYMNKLKEIQHFK
tara:strand:+ start:30 stop:1430 length:1401 start_codon:yes stop_codon:yes gene_type:complete